MTSVTHTKTFALDVPIDDLFPLFSPEGEKLWVPGWDYEDILGTTQLAEDYVFLTKNHLHGTTDAVWIVKTYDPQSYLVQFYKIEPEQKVGVVTVKCSPRKVSTTEVQVTYKYIALSKTGEEFVSTFNETEYERLINDWHRLLSGYFERKA